MVQKKLKAKLKLVKNINSKRFTNIKTNQSYKLGVERMIGVFWHEILLLEFVKLLKLVA